MEGINDENIYFVRDPKAGPAGKALIINVRKERRNTARDETKMKEVFNHLNLIVEEPILRDPTANEIKEEVVRFRNKIKQEDAKNFDLIAVCIMAHGKEGFIGGSDYNLVDLRKDVMQMFSNENCDVLDKKPRLFFFQACRGEKMDLGIDGLNTNTRRREHISYNLCLYDLKF